MHDSGHHGLTPETASKAAAIIHRLAEVEAVAITDATSVLAYVGQGCPYMVPGTAIHTKATQRVLHTGETEVVQDKSKLDCPVPGCPCPVQSAVIVPLKIQGQVIGTVKLYRHRPSAIAEHAQRLAVGISELISLHLELAEAEHQRQLLMQARLAALQAQIRPHFLFNTLNTIIAQSRARPEKARELLAELAQFLRHSLMPAPDEVEVADEVDYVELYLRLEQARFGDRLHCALHIDPAALRVRIPVLTLQPLVENAIVHGLSPKDGPGRMSLMVRSRRRYLSILVADDGVGIARDRLPFLFEPGYGAGTGLGLANVRERLQAQCGPGTTIRVRSRLGRGTVVWVRIPHGPQTGPAHWGAGRAVATQGELEGRNSPWCAP
ncbi:MAG: histidine kinase [Firmicutes bacterium]|nr:histidine kinase [Alicyclobacillaceae bacterium]MCL6496400.1 histidine kinase [Bacillota bacterium]